ncbi:RNA-directed DNA polymerase [Mesorhizobium sp.]|uniref:RNA-directed DNA polymerase n=1 Tax=Mesorhizobium sp. TaxID=1871066 RepID=UPI0011F99FDD|nr:RNA-directed DNA polymerase [Mesorhizobium sp.]TIQ44611.1 MAG: RNA-directed DNA polymerase [Mesorhizobium sp.]TIQ54345.1 MAG: RNA-directed DNA polymerase [Mesorhizobium sp.]
MKSPRFDIRAAPLRKIFSPSNLERIWKEKVRIAMRDQFLNDGIENFDFHVARRAECQKLSRLILDGDYVPARAQRILVEKSKGLCRQLVIPSVRDAIVLQCLSDALYAEIRGKAPTKKSFFEPKEHGFSATRHDYGTFASWLNFQKELFRFSKSREFVVVTDIANYYDSISYYHLRNVISSIAGVQECVLDMLIYVLSDLLWQPDYTPRVEVGLPQINMDAPRLLAHCFLYELDAFLDSDPSRDFVRYMDDIDVGVDNIVSAKNVLRSIDLVLQTKQVRLNSGKTQILTRADALTHFRVHENARLDFLEARIDRKLKAGLALGRERRFIEVKVRTGLRSGSFDTGAGDKILKRWFTLAGKTEARIAPKALLKIITLRPSVREKVFGYTRQLPLSPAKAKVLADAAGCGLLIDDAGIVEMSNHLVETLVLSRYRIDDHIDAISQQCDPETYFGLYGRLWLQSKYASPSELLDTVKRSQRLWLPHERLGRIVGSFAPLFVGTLLETDFLDVLASSRNNGTRDTYKFHVRLGTDPGTFAAMFDALRNPNPSRGTAITHDKFLCLLSALKNKAVPAARTAALLAANSKPFQDVYYRGIGRGLKLI